MSQPRLTRVEQAVRRAQAVRISNYHKFVKWLQFVRPHRGVRTADVLWGKSHAQD
jgi:hypothetical protein